MVDYVLSMKNKKYNTLYKKAIIAGKNRNYKKAVTNLLELISETDKYPEAYLYLGRSYHALGKYEESIRALRYYINSVPESSAGYFFLGRSYIACKMYKFAVFHLKKALILFPDSSQILSYLAMGYLRLKRTDLALEYLEKAVELEPDNKTIYSGYLNSLFMQAVKTFHRGDFNLSRQMFQFVWDKGNRGILINLYLASIEKNSGNFDTALFHYNEAVKISPNDSLLLFRRAAMLYFTGKKEKAVQELTRLNIMQNAESFSWNNENINRFLAINYFQQKQFRQAVFYGIQFLHKDNSDIDIHLLAGESYRELGEWIKAKNHFQRAVELDRTKVESRYGLAVVYWQEGKWEEMLKVLNIIERYNPGNNISSYYTVLCKCKLNYPPSETIKALQMEIKKSNPDPFLFTAIGEQFIKDDYEDFSEKWFKKAIVLDPKHESAYSGLIKVYSLLKMKTKLSKSFKNYLEKYPDNRTIRGDYIQHLFNIENYAPAAVEIEKHLLYKKDDSKYQRLLAISYRKSKKYKEAVIVYKKLLRENPKNTNFLESLVFCLDKWGKRTTAVLLLKNSFSFIKPSLELLLIYGVLLYREGDTKNALKSFRSVLDISPKDWRAHKNIGLAYKKQGMDAFAEKYLRNSEKYRVSNGLH